MVLIHAETCGEQILCHKNRLRASRYWPPSWTISIRSLEPTGWKGRTESCKLPTDVCLHVVAHMRTQISKKQANSFLKDMEKKQDNQYNWTFPDVSFLPCFCVSVSRHLALSRPLLHFQSCLYAPERERQNKAILTPYYQKSVQCPSSACRTPSHLLSSLTEAQTHV